MLVDHRSAVEQWALRAQRSARNEKEYGEYFEDLVQPDLLLHVTYGGAKPPGRKTAVRQIKQQLREIEIAAGRPIAWVAALDYGRTNRLHFHILVGNVAGLSRRKLSEAMRRKFGRVRIDPFEPGRGGAEYVAKNGLSDLGDLEFGGQLLEHRSEQIAASRGEKFVKNARKEKSKRLTIHIDGAGPNGSGSRIARVVVGTRIARVKPVDARTSNEAEYRALRWALLKIPKGGAADIFSDSQLIVNQFNGKWAVRDPKMKKQLYRVQEIVSDRQLDIRLTWIPREENLAGRLL